MIKNEKDEPLIKMKEFIETIQVLLIAYHNLGMVAYKMGNLKYSTKVFE